MNIFGFEPKIVPLLFNRLMFVETVDLYSSNIFDDLHGRCWFTRFISIVLQYILHINMFRVCN